MRCHEFEKRLLRSLDERLSPEEQEVLKTHMAVCSLCRRKDAEFRMIRGLLRTGGVPEPMPNFWERLAPRLEDRTPGFLSLLGAQKAMKAICAALGVMVFAAGALLLFVGQKPEQMTQSEILLFQDENPFLETRTLLEEKKVEKKGLMLIFASTEESLSSKRDLP